MDSSRPCLQMPLCRGVEIEELSITQLQNHLEKARFLSRDLTECYLKRIELINPRIKAVIEANPDSLGIADELDSERKNGHIRSQIHGIPFLVKDNISTKDKMQTTAGCAALEGTIVPHDAHVVTLLRAAGGILLGKANLSEWASMRASYYAEGYSSRGGQNRNPYNLAEHPGGSSSGSASAVAANMCAFSIGTETDGSVMFPADRCAVVGIKPTVGLTSTLGVIPEAPSLDTVGTFGRSVEDVAIVLNIIAHKSATTGSQPHAVRPSVDVSSIERPFTSWLANTSALKGVRFGLPQKRIWDTARESQEHKAEHIALEHLFKRLQEAGTLILEVDFPSAEEIIAPDGWDWEYGDGETGSKLSEFEVVKTEFYRSLPKYLSSLRSNKNQILSLEDVIAYNIKHTNQDGGVPGTHPAWPTGQDNFDRCVQSKYTDDSVYTKALEYIIRKSRHEGIDAALRHEEGILDGLLVPLQADGGAACSLAAKAGYPMIAIPVGVSEIGVPFGIGIIQTAWREDLLVKYGSAIEGLIGYRHRPTFKNFDADNYPYIGNPSKK
ncbi:amidase signature enzyme [Microthyrium microscopicum]|uniref:Amidase signature enzyme n=1 Tax=Microthyrium microscopicum TaxID=703497 RepID=A0A6A6U514_9PEZI|nr:amidase signature enzyme [Microthyrium microscopicum]